MGTLQLYGLDKCSTCQKARQWLTAQGVPHTFTDYREHPVDPVTLRQWAEGLGGWEKLVNRASMTWRHLPDSRKAPAGDDDWLALIAEFPALVRRPVAVAPDGGVSVGFSEKRYAGLFGG